MLDPKLYTFLMVAELQNYTKAANTLGLTQPAVSQHIAKLEQHYQQTFIQTVNKKVLLTEAGQIFYHYAKQQKANEEKLTQQFNHMKAKLNMGATLSIADYYLPLVINNQFESKMPELAIHVGNTKSLLKKILDGELDCAFIEGLFDRQLFDYKKYYTENFVPVVNSHHPLLHKKITIEDLFDYPLILREKGSGTRNILDNYLFQQNYSCHQFQNIYEFGSFVLIKEMLKKSNAISFMYYKVAQKEIENGELSILSIDHYQLKHSFYFVYLKNAIHKQFIEEFYESILKHEDYN